MRLSGKTRRLASTAMTRGATKHSPQHTNQSRFVSHFIMGHNHLDNCEGRELWREVPQGLLHQLRAPGLGGGGGVVPHPPGQEHQPPGARCVQVAWCIAWCTARSCSQCVIQNWVRDLVHDYTEGARSCGWCCQLQVQRLSFRTFLHFMNYISQRGDWEKVQGCDSWIRSEERMRWVARPEMWQNTVRLK